MMGIFKIFNSDLECSSNDNMQTLYSKPLHSESLSVTSSVSSLSELERPFDSSNNNLDVVTKNQTPKDNDQNLKEVQFASGDGSDHSIDQLKSYSSHSTNLMTAQSSDSNNSLRNREEELLKEIESERAITRKTYEVIKEFQDLLTNVIKDRDTINDHKQIALTHLTNLEFAFYDLTTKYERAKHCVEQYRENEAILLQTLENAETLLKHREEKYQILKKHATEKINEANMEIEKMRKNNAIEVAKLNAVIKKSECKINSLEQQLEQKISENTQMAKLWDDLNSNIQSEVQTAECQSDPV